MTASASPPPVRVSDHIGLAHLAVRAFRAHVGRGFDYEDLVQAACEGLLYAAQSFDPARGAFSTYAVPMAKKFVKRLVATQARTVKCPEHSQDRAAAAGRPRRPAPESPRERRTAGVPFDWSKAAVGPAPAPVRLPYMGVPSSWSAAQPDPWDVPRTAAGARLDGKAEPDQVHAPGAELSFDFARPDSESESTMHDFLGSDPAGPNPEDLAAEHEKRPLVLAALGALNPAQRRVMVLRLMGFTQPEIGRRMGGLSKQRVEQIEREAAAILAAELAE